MSDYDVREYIESGRAVMGLEMGSTRIKAVLIGKDHEPIVSGGYGWENKLVDGIWTYDMEDVFKGIAGCYADMAADVKNKYGISIRKLSAIGISAMMHGYLVFDKNDRLLVPFRTWRNGITGQAADELTGLFNFNIPERWSIAHIYQAILNGEEHVKDIAFLTTLSGYVHYCLTGEKVIGLGDASGMFPVDSKTKDYDEEAVKKFDALLGKRGLPYGLRDIFPKVIKAGEKAGTLRSDRISLLDKSGELEAGVAMAPPEGDAGTGMVATNSIRPGTGNVSAGTSAFGMLVLEKPLQNLHREIDMVTTPDGRPVAMAHANNCASDLDAWVGIIGSAVKGLGFDVEAQDLYSALYNEALKGDADCGGVLSYGYFAGEQVMKCDKGRPMVVRMPDAKFNLANFMRANIYTAFGALKVGMDILVKEEKVKVSSILGQGGLFKTKGVAQRFLAAALNAPVSVMETAGEGGPWAMALLAAYMVNKEEGEGLADYLDNKVFKEAKTEVVQPDPADVEGFEAFIQKYKSGIEIQKAAVRALS